MQLRKLGRRAEALDSLDRLQALIEGRLQGVTPLPEDERRTLLIQLLRAARYQSEMDHEVDAHGSANGRLVRLSQDAATRPIFQDHLEFRARLERAQFHEVHACVRARLTGDPDPNGMLVLPSEGVARQSLAAARADYIALLEQTSQGRFSWPAKLWRWLKRSDRKDGSALLRAAARQGLRRLDDIEAGKGCQFCRPMEPLAV